MHESTDCLIDQLNESEKSEDEAEMKAASERAAQSNVKKYVPPKIAPVHYGNVFLTSFILLKFMFLRKLIRLTERFIFVFFLQMETWQRLTGKRLRWSVSGERF